MIARLTNTQLLSMWERASKQLPPRRALTLLCGAGFEAQYAARLAVGEREWQLLMLRKNLFGEQVEAMTECEKCQSPVEICFNIMELAERAPAAAVPAETLSSGYAVRWRLPTCGDLVELTHERSPERLRARLLELCLLGAREGEREITVHECPANVIDEVCDAMREADPYGDIRFDLSCPVCRHVWQASFDAGSFVWREIDVWARRLIREIHSLASVYGWSEEEILALPVKRRAAYLELVGA